MERPLTTYQPNPILGWLYERFFDHIQVDEAWAEKVREADARGTVVYVLRSVSYVDFLALDYLTKRYRLPEIRFASDLGLWVLEPLGKGWLSALTPRSERDDNLELRRAVETGASAVLFLKRPPAPLEGSRGRNDGDAYFRTLLSVQQASKRPILFVPQVFVWSKAPDEIAKSLVDTVLGPPEWPGRLRTTAQFLANYRNVTMRLGEPVDLEAFLEAEAGAEPDVLVKRLNYTLLRRLERERRAVIGPQRKPRDRLREQVLRTPKLQRMIGDMAGEGSKERRVLSQRAVAMLREMEADPDVMTLRGMAKAAHDLLHRFFATIEVDEAGLERLRSATKEGAVILLPSHKSHVDYILISTLLFERHIRLPMIAAGENLNFFPVGPLFRRSGAFYIRRSFKGDRLYGAVVDAYMRRLLMDGHTLEFFLEGGRSRTGKLLPPKLGLLSLVVDAAVEARAKKVTFVPISIGYERMVEEKAYIRELTGGEKPKEDVKGLVSSAGLLAQRYGRLNVQFGDFLTLEGMTAELGLKKAVDELTPPERRALITRLAFRTMNEINRATAVTPAAVVATALLTHDKRGLGHDELIAQCNRVASTLAAFGARFSPSLLDPHDPRRLREAAYLEACELFSRAGHLDVLNPSLEAPAGEGAREKDRVQAASPGEGAVYVVRDGERISLDLSKNILVHFFVARGLVATALFASFASMGTSRPPVPVATLKERVQFLSRLFKFEFQFRAGVSFDQIVDETLAAMIDARELVRIDEGLHLEEGEGRKQVVLYAQSLRGFVEGYRVAARALTLLLKGPLTQRDLAKKALATGERMFLEGEVQRREGICRPILENAILSFLDQKILQKTEQKVELAASYRSPDTVQIVESRIALFLGRRDVRGGTDAPPPPA